MSIKRSNNSNTQIASISDLVGKAKKDKDESPAEKLDQKIKEINIKQSEAIINAQADSLGVGYIDLKDFPISPEAIIEIEKGEAEALGAVCFYKSENDVRIATTNPQNREVLEVFEKIKSENPRAKVELYMISSFSLARALKAYESIPKIKEIVKGVAINKEDIKEFEGETFNDFSELQKKIKNVSMTKIINLIVAASLTMRASDLHIEAEEKDIVVRYRIDGILHEVARLSMDSWTKVIARVKILSGLKINVTNRPQDGRFTIFLDDDKVDVRVSTLPTAFGESVVMRLLKSSATSLGFEDLGIEGRSYEQLKHEVERPNGMIITTGPTGSGKTTTLYAILNKLNDEETKIITLEDPIEYKLKGINQSQITHGEERGYDFADGLRAILRQDPDIVMVGEIRDLETGETAINAALTGHLVVSTIHTNSAPAAIPRFMAMGVKPFLLAPALNAVIGQRLCRRICKECKTEIELDKSSMDRVLKIIEETPKESIKDIDIKDLKFYKGLGCEKCQGLGYKGRIGIYEVFVMNEEVEKVILSGLVSEYEMHDIARKQGMVTMVQDGILKALGGVTTVDEVFRVIE